MGISRLFNKPTRISLIKRSERFYLGIFYDNAPASAYMVTDKWEELEPLEGLLSEDAHGEFTIPFDDVPKYAKSLATLAAACAKIRKISIVIDEEAKRLKLLDAPPPDCVISWRLRGEGLSMHAGDDVLELPDGWYRRADEYWRYDKLSANELERLRRKSIEKRDILTFLKTDIPIFRDLGINFSCDISISERHALEMTFTQVERDQVTIALRWNIAPEDIDASFQLRGYTLANGVLYPGISPQELASHISFENDTKTLLGSEIASFLDVHYEYVKPWFESVREFEASHMWLTPPYEWILVASAQKLHGVGRAFATPMAVIGEDEVPLEAFLNMTREPYTRLTRGWVKRVDLLAFAAELQKARPDEQIPKRIALTPEQIVSRGDAQLIGPWKRMAARGAPWVSSKQKQAAAREHIDYLIGWGVSGGITGGYEAAVAYGSRAVAELLANDASAKTLIVGSETDIDEYAKAVSSHACAPIARYEPGSPRIAYLAAYSALSESVAAGVTWDAIILIEPECLKADRALRGLRSNVFIGFFNVHASALDGEGRQMIKNALGLSVSDEILYALIQSPRAISMQPAPYAFTGETPKAVSTTIPPIFPAPSQAKVVREDGFNITLDGPEARSTAIPPRPQTAAESIIYARAQIISTQEAFFKEARKMASVGGASNAPHVPFMSYSPTYADMDARQKKWYFHMRGEIRHDRYPDTDLSYLFIYIYELLNGIGCVDWRASFDALMKLWLNYRARQPKLDDYMPGWLLDFIVLRRPGMGFCEFMLSAPALTKVVVDCGLSEFGADDALLLPVPALELMSGYAIRRSKLYISGYGDILEKMLPRVVALADRAMRSNSGCGMLKKYALDPVVSDRTAYASAIMERSETYKLTYTPYCDNAACTEFLYQLLRYAENALRVQLGFQSKLRGVSLDPAYREWVDAYIRRQFQEPKTNDKRAESIQLDSDAIRKLREESNDVREALIAATYEREEVVSEIGIDDIFIPERPADAPEGLLTDIAPVSRVIHMLTVDERKLINSLKPLGWETDTDKLRGIIDISLIEAVIDGVNSRAIEQLGVHLIEREGERIVIADDYTDELEFILNAPSDGQSQVDLDAEDIDPEWLEFLGHTDINALSAALNGYESLKQYAAERGELIDLIVDSINEAAVDAIGDLLIDENGIVADYEPIVRQCLRKEP